MRRSHPARGGRWPRFSRSRPGTLACAAVVAIGVCSQPARAAPPLALGIDAGGPLASADPSVSGPWATRFARLGATVVRITVSWSGVAPATRLLGFDAADPATPDYSWGSTDAVVRNLAANGLSVLIQVGTAPSWAEGPSRSSSAPPGTWEPNAQALGQFARAAALRYSGTYPDPAASGESSCRGSGTGRCGMSRTCPST